MKVCSKCNIEQTLDNFVKNIKQKDGLHYSCKQCRKEYNIKASKEIAIYKQQYIEKNREQIKAKRKIYNKNNKAIIDEFAKVYYKLNKDKVIKRITNYRKNRIKIDPIYKMSCNLRTRISDFVKERSYIKNTTTEKLLGITYEELKIWLENQFTKEMNWDNYGRRGWHIDHKVPLVSAKTEEELWRLCHYTNLQPLWWIDNLKKSGKF